MTKSTDTEIWDWLAKVEGNPKLLRYGKMWFLELWFKEVGRGDTPQAACADAMAEGEGE